MPKRVAIGDIIGFIKQGYSDMNIVQYLREQGYNSNEIKDLMNQAKAKMEIARTSQDSDSDDSYEGEVPLPPKQYSETDGEQTEEQEESAPQQQYSYNYGQKPVNAEYVEEIAEEIINEKWNEFKSSVGDISELKNYIDSRLSNLNERIKKIDINIEKIKSVILEKIQENSRDVKNMSAEMQALQSVFSKVLQPFVSSVRELNEIMDKIKSRKEKTEIPKTAEDSEDKKKHKKKARK